MRTTIATAGPSQRSWWRQAVAILAAGLMGLGFIGLGSPAAQADDPTCLPDEPCVTNVNDDYTAPQGGQWTFEATGFDPEGTLYVYLGDDTGPLLRSYPLDENGDTGTVAPDYTRVPIAVSNFPTTGEYELYFIDSAFTELYVPITVTTPASVTVTTASSGVTGGSLTVTGSGWTTTNVSASAIVALKIEQASDSSVTYNHLPGYPADPDISANLTIWAYARPDANGDFSITITLPSGTTGANGSNPEFGTGSYRVRALAGSLQTGDRAGVALSAVFTVS
ncbi:MAG: hypothetical protein LBK54_05130 [Propionibacteriaceae bacterium]|jgi:hypothetical protein|nr:hypothetical protein [Propionibacteriaceae bacterium]